MKILLLSDSHQNEITIDLTKYDHVIHCGDYGKSLPLIKQNKVHYVRGNCDSEGIIEEVLEIEGRKIFYTHGHYYDVKQSYDRIIYRGLELGVDIIMFGHTHIPIHKEEEGMLVLNPGAWMDGFMIEIIDDTLIYSMDGRIYKKFEYKW